MKATIFIHNASDAVLDAAESICVASGTDSDVFLDLETALERITTLDHEDEAVKELVEILMTATKEEAEYVHLF